MIEVEVEVVVVVMMKGSSRETADLLVIEACDS
jgi:hypothetical protein